MVLMSDHMNRNKGNYELRHVHDDVIRLYYWISRRVSSDETPSGKKKEDLVFGFQKI